MRVVAAALREDDRSRKALIERAPDIVGIGRQEQVGVSGSQVAARARPRVNTRALDREAVCLAPS